MAYKEQTQEMWLPKNINDKLEGKIIEINTEGMYGNQYHIEQDDGSVIVTPSHKVLQNRIINCSKGDKVKIVFEGEEAPKVKGQNPTKMYKVYKDE